MGKLILSLTFLSALFFGSVAAQQNDKHNMTQLLTGWWMGKYKSCGGPNNIVCSERNLYLNVRQSPLTGRFSLGTGGTWETTVQVTNDKILIRIDREMREFVLKEKGGKLLLEANYETSWPGWPSANVIVLEKTGDS